MRIIEMTRENPWESGWAAEWVRSVPFPVISLLHVVLPRSRFYLSFPVLVGKVIDEGKIYQREDEQEIHFHLSCLLLSSRILPSETKRWRKRKARYKIEWKGKEIDKFLSHPFPSLHSFLLSFPSFLPNPSFSFPNYSPFPRSLTHSPSRSLIKTPHSGWPIPSSSYTRPDQGKGIVDAWGWVGWREWIGSSLRFSPNHHSHSLYPFPFHVLWYPSPTVYWMRTWDERN